MPGTEFSMPEHGKHRCGSVYRDFAQNNTLNPCLKMAPQSLKHLGQLRSGS
jgi:hypothetical protein